MKIQKNVQRTMQTQAFAKKLILNLSLGERRAQQRKTEYKNNELNVSQT